MKIDFSSSFRSFSSLFLSFLFFFHFHSLHRPCFVCAFPLYFAFFFHFSHIQLNSSCLLAMKEHKNHPNTTHQQFFHTILNSQLKSNSTRHRSKHEHDGMNEGKQRSEETDGRMEWKRKSTESTD